MKKFSEFFVNLFKLLKKYNILSIFIIVLYYVIIFSDLLLKGGFLAVVFSLAGWIFVPLSLVTFYSILLERFDNRFINVIYGFSSIVAFYIILFTIEETLGTFGMFYNENCIPSYWNLC